MCTSYKRPDLLLFVKKVKTNGTFLLPISPSLAGTCVSFQKSQLLLVDTLLYRMNEFFQVSSRVQLINQMCHLCVPKKKDLKALCNHKSTSYRRGRLSVR